LVSDLLRRIAIQQCKKQKFVRALPQYDDDIDVLVNNWHSAGCVACPPNFPLLRRQWLRCAQWQRGARDDLLPLVGMHDSPGLSSPRADFLAITGDFEIFGALSLT
jgi:hypothetical protein